LALNRSTHADEAEQQLGGGQPEGHRNAGEQEEEQADEQQRHEVLVNEGAHVSSPGPGAGRPLVSQFGGQLMLVELLAVGAERLAAVPGDEGHALDQFGQRLHQQDGEAQRHQQQHRPADQAAGVLAHLARGPGAFEQRPAEVDHDERQRDREDTMPMASMMALVRWTAATR
jgi:hypothetical protein